MARPRSQLHSIFKNLPGVAEAYFQAPSTMQYPCIMYERSDSEPSYADNILYRLKKGYQVIVIDRNPDSLIPDLVEALPYCRFVRFYRANGFNHTVFELYF